MSSSLFDDRPDGDPSRQNEGRRASAEVECVAADAIRDVDKRGAWLGCHWQRTEKMPAALRSWYCKGFVAWVPQAEEPGAGAKCGALVQDDLGATEGT